jgi:serine/threonine-protein kinase RsbW
MTVHKLKIPSDLQNLNRVEKFVEEICDYYNITDLYFGNILTALTESVSNAIIHGNKSDKTKHVDISAEFIEGGLSFTIKDEGDGFDYNRIPDPTEFVEDCKTGRGLFIMSSLSDNLEFKNNGNVVVMKFEISGLDENIIKNRINKMSKYAGIKPHRQLSSKKKQD